MPLPGARVGREFAVSGWAFKDGVGLDAVEVTLDGLPVASADYGSAQSHVEVFWRISTDPAQPDVGFSARVALPPGSEGTHWLGLNLRGKDGSVEPWQQQRIEVVP